MMWCPQWRRLLRRFLPRGMPSPASHTLEAGQRAEEYAARNLGKAGYQILARNMRIAGVEIDMLALHGGYLVVLEVRSYPHNKARKPRSALTREKIERLRRAGSALLREPRYRHLALQVDLVEVAVDANANPCRLEIVEGIC